jgi:hypothetical protein
MKRIPLADRDLEPLATCHGALVGLAHAGLHEATHLAMGRLLREV